MENTTALNSSEQSEFTNSLLPTFAKFKILRLLPDLDLIIIYLYVKLS